MEQEPQNARGPKPPFHVPEDINPPLPHGTATTVFHEPGMGLELTDFQACPFTKTAAPWSAKIFSRFEIVQGSA